MHPISFLQKRGHLCAVARGRDMFEHVDDMTPARFDILYAIHHHDPVRLGPAGTIYAMDQVTLTRKLGLARQTVWKMVERLVELGLLAKTKNRNGGDPRRNILVLTAAGVERTREAMTAAFTESVPLSRGALKEGIGHRNARRIALAERRVARSAMSLGRSRKPVKIGREVEKIYTAFAWNRVEGGRRGKQYRQLELLDNTITFFGELAKALGNNTPSLYTIRFTEENDL